jgi:hypothetical protein
MPRSWAPLELGELSPTISPEERTAKTAPPQLRWRMVCRKKIYTKGDLQ